MKCVEYLASSVLCVAFCSGASSRIIEDFEGYTDTADLNTAVFGVQPNTTVTLDMIAGVGDSAGLIFEGANGSDPFFSQFSLDTNNISLDGIDSVNFSARFVGGSGENLITELIDEFGGVVSRAEFGRTQLLPTDSFSELSVDTSFTSQAFHSIRFSFGGIDFGTTAVVIDNISAIPAPGAGVLGITIVCAMVRRRRA
ncbi:MAG: hypothetical protein AAGB34_06745 [Planctomycetota bacterium]